MFRKFLNRIEGGRTLAAKLLKFRNDPNVIVLALPRGGVPVAAEVVKALHVPLGVFLVRKLGVPFREELAFGAIASGGVTVFNESLVETFRIPPVLVEKVIRQEQAELERREKLYHSIVSPSGLRDKTVIIVDDGLATGATMRAAITAVRSTRPKQIIVAVPVSSRETCAEIDRISADIMCVCASKPEPFYGVGTWYRDFTQISDAEVCRLLEASEEMNLPEISRAGIASGLNGE